MPVPRSLLSRLATALSLSLSHAQTYTKCNPLNSTCPADVALGTTVDFDFTSVGINPQVWDSTSSPINFGNKGGEFTVAQSGDGPNMNTQFSIFFGTISVMLKAANGTGICSSIVLLSDDRDEIDIEACSSSASQGSLTGLDSWRQPHNGRVQLLWQG